MDERYGSFREIKKLSFLKTNETNFFKSFEQSLNKDHFLQKQKRVLKKFTEQKILLNDSSVRNGTK